MRREVMERLGLGFVACASWSFFAFVYGAGQLDTGLLLTAISAAGAWFWCETRPPAIIPQTQPRMLIETFSKNDIRVALMLAQQDASSLGYLLNKHEYWNLISIERLQPLSDIYSQWDRRVLFFQNRLLSDMLCGFMERLDNLKIKLAHDTAPQHLNGVMVTGYKPLDVVPADCHDELLDGSRAAGALAMAAGKSLSEIVAYVKLNIPEAFDEPLDV